MGSTYDVVIVGGGVIGSSIAFHLSKSKHISVALVDVKKKGNASYASAGGLWQLGDLLGLGGCGQLEGDDNAETEVAASHSGYPDYFFDLCMKSNSRFPDLRDEFRHDYGIDFKYEKSGLKYIVYNEWEIGQAKNVASNIEHLKSHFIWLDQQDLRKNEPNISCEALGSLMFVNDHQVNPFLLVDAYREGARKNGVKLYLNSHVSDITVQKHRIAAVATDKEELRCHTLINAAGAWAGEIMGLVTKRHLPVKPIKGQCLISEKLPKILNSCLSSSDCFMAQKDRGEILIGSTTEDVGFDASCTFDSLWSLAKGAIRCLPVLRHTHIKRSWVGFRPGSPDGMPILGPVLGIDNYFNACGHYKTGILTSAITGEIFAALLNGQEPPVDIQPFLINRFDTS